MGIEKAQPMGPRKKAMVKSKDNKFKKDHEGSAGSEHEARERG